MSIRSLLISHVDLDGVSVIVVARSMGLEFTDMECHDYHFDLESGVLDRLMTYDKIVVADLALNESIHRALLEAGKIVEVYDHHDNEENSYIAGLEGSLMDHTRCGTKLFFEEYACKHRSRYPSLLREFVELVNTYDLWQKTSPLWDEAMSMNRVLYKYNNYNEKTDKLKAAKDFIDEQVLKICSGATSWFWTVYEKQAIESAKEMESLRLTQALKEMTFRIDRRGKQFAVFSLPGKISYVASEVLSLYDFLDYCFIINTFRTISGKVSTRSSQGFNCPDLAMVNGHPAAAGGLISPEDAKLMLVDVNMVPIYKDDPEFLEDQARHIIYHDQTLALKNK